MGRTVQNSVDNIDTIVACATPMGAGALAIVRLSGSSAIEIVDSFATIAHKRLTECPSHTIHFARLFDGAKNLIDTVMLSIMRAPKSFTGEDSIEITCHNNPFIINAIITRCIELGARVAHAGEFTQRAYLGKKIDILQAEAIHELIAAHTQEALKRSLAQLDGTLSQWVAHLEKKLLTALAYSEASFEFLDDEAEFAPVITRLITECAQVVASLTRTMGTQQQIKQGIRIALIGAVNAGKSSLFNALIGKNRAIVSSIPGTTRDTVEAGVYTQQDYWTIIDTAGLRETDNIIEKQGIARSHEEANTADIILLIYDSSVSLTPLQEKIYCEIYTTHARKTVRVGTKRDIFAVSHSWDILVATHDPQDIQKLEKLLIQKSSNLHAAHASPFILNKRQSLKIIELEQQLNAISSLLSQPRLPYELISTDLKAALAHIGDLTGKTVSEAGMDLIFREFCVGK